MSEEKLKYSVNVCNGVIDLYRDILHSYVSDFYIEAHWNQKLPCSWKEFLDNLTIEQIGELINYENESFANVAPLTFLCLRGILKTFSVNRKQVHLKCERKDEHFMKFLWKSVKLKKRHEIEIISKICYDTAVKTNCFNIIDIGSGLGHLSRLLSFHYGFNVCTLEANNKLVQLAPALDNQFEKMLLVKGIPHICKRKPIHVNMRIEETLTREAFELLVRKIFNNYDDNFKFGIVGLHPCGNLGSTLLRLYNESPNAIFINIVSCCYMKLSLDGISPFGFPLSEFFIDHNYSLDYLSCETACHAIENYIEKIKVRNYHHLKIHSFRAALECLLFKTNKKLRHCAVGNVKYEEGMTFKEYCYRATKKYNLIFSSQDLDYYEKLIEDTWTKVVKFYSVRLLLAPLVESIILYDRLLYLQENKSNCVILPVFNCKISPRNHVLSAQKFS